MKKYLVAGLVACSIVFAAVAEEPAALSNRIKWATASEVENFGFDVYRGDSEEGPFEKINAATIPGAGSTDTPSRYEYIDADIEPGQAYWYYVESISMSGQRQKFTPTLQSMPKYPPAADG